MCWLKHLSVFESLHEDKPRTLSMLAQSVPLDWSADRLGIQGYHRSTGVAVAILDTGVDNTHPFFERGSCFRGMLFVQFRTDSLTYLDLSWRASPTLLLPGLRCHTWAPALREIATMGPMWPALQPGTLISRLLLSRVWLQGASIIAIQVFSQCLMTS